VGSTNQEPLLAEGGEQGEYKALRLELKLLADIGLIGMPNAGKSSILAGISAARPKIANYPFTTLNPVLGVVYHQLDAFVVVDIPGLIEGAHEGTGLGDEFLKHVERTRVLVHVVDGSESDIAVRLKTINQELAEFNAELANVPQIMVVNKQDLPEVSELRAEIEEQVRDVVGDGKRVLFISAATHEGVDQLVTEMWRQLQQTPRSPVAADEPTSEEEQVLRPQPRRREPEIQQVDDSTYRVLHPRAIRLARGSNLDNWHALVQYQAKLSDLGVTRALVRAGVKTGDIVQVEDWEFEWD
jgi:GTP-binding protein